MSWRAAAVVGSLGLIASCNRDPEVEQRSVVVYSARSCPVPDTAFSVMYAHGDFDAPAQSSQLLNEIGRELSLPPAARSLVVDIGADDQSWRAVGSVSVTGTTNVLAWQRTQACPLTTNVERRTDMAFGVFGQRFMVVGGRALDGGAVPHTFVGDLTTGAVDQLRVGLKTSRIRPTVTAFGDGAVVAAGSDPSSDAPLDTAEVYSPSAGDFDPVRIELSQRRMLHGAVQLGTGETLLVGGRGENGLLRTMEIIDPATRSTRTAGVASLAVARSSPTVLRLANGEILVAGGFDASGVAVPTLEWFSRDASQATKRAIDLVTGKERSFVALEAGGALAVIRPDTPTPDFKTVWVITADGTLEPATAIDPMTLDRVRLFRGSEGAPMVWTGNRWLRWAPWSGAFSAAGTAPGEGPTLDAIDNGDPGLALWVKDLAITSGDQRFVVTGFRFAARTPFEAVRNPLLNAGPIALAPDRLVGLGPRTIRFDARGVVLEPGASAFVTDVSFADFTLDLDVTANPPLVVLRDTRGAELEIGGASCAFAQSATRSLHVVRKGTRVDVSVDGAAARTCPTLLADDVRVSIGLRGLQATGVSAARNLRILR